MRPTMMKTWIPPTNAGILRTLHVMAGLAREPSRLVADVAAMLRRQATGWGGFPAELRRWLLTHTVQELDPYQVELIRSPEWSLVRILDRGRMAGDCDDVAVLAAGLALAAGYQTRFVVLAWDGIYSHVYAEVRDPATGQWVDQDVQKPFLQAPREPERETVFYVAGRDGVQLGRFTV